MRNDFNLLTFLLKLLTLNRLISVEIQVKEHMVACCYSISILSQLVSVSARSHMFELRMIS